MVFNFLLNRIFSKKQKYNTYQDYLDHQKEKTLDPQRREKWLGKEWESKLTGFNEVFQRHSDVLKTCRKAICIGARTGQEVKALRDLGIDAIGIDLVPHPPLVIEGDMHNIPFEDGSFDFAFSNCFDHSLHPDRFISEMERVTKPGGHALIQLQIGVSQDKYTETKVKSSSQVTKLFKQSKIVEDKQIPQNFAAMNWEILARKS